MKEFKKGDKVVCSVRGDGVVTDMLQVLNYPVIASFKNVMESYTADGRRLKDGPITLRHAEPEQPQLLDLTKILKVGDEIWDSRYGEIEVLEINNINVHPIVAKRKSTGYRLSFTKDGRPTKDTEITLYPIDQKPDPPQWPLTPQTYEWEGGVYEVGEWVAVCISASNWALRQLTVVDDHDTLPILCNVTRYDRMRKLKSFNQD